LDDPDHFTRQALIGALGVWGSGKNVPALVRLLEHKDVVTRRSAIQVLGKLKDPQAVEPLVKCFLDFHTRSEASQALEAIGPAAEKAVLKLLGHKDVFIRRDACAILKTIGTQESAAVLQGIVDRNDVSMFHSLGPAKEALKAIAERQKSA